jgi:hypothetical protein
MGDAPKNEAEEKSEKAEKLTTYVVHKTNILDDAGKKIRHGETVDLSPALARHYNKLGFLRPYIEEPEDADETTTPSRSKRFGGRGA